MNRSAIIRWVGVVLWMGVIFGFSSQPHLPHLPQAVLDLLLKKGAHFMVYAVLATLFLAALKGRANAGGMAWLLTVLYACSDEWHQSFVPGRQSSGWDVLIDACGAAFALLLVSLLVRQFRSSKRVIDRLQADNQPIIHPPS